jgi:ATP-binding cassette subfamily B (MDR/TAP) protein 1
MVRGEIVEQGTHENLLLNKGLYSRLVEAQDLNDTEEEENSTIHEKSSENTEEKKETLKRTLSRYEDIETGQKKVRSTFQVIKQIAILNSPEINYTVPGLLASIGSGLVYPFFAISFGELVSIFSKRGQELTDEATKWSLVFVGIAFTAFTFTFLMHTLFGIASEHLVERVRKMAYNSILRQDVGFFDEEKNTTGSLTGSLANDAQQVKGVSGSILGAILQLSGNIFGGAVVSYYYNWKMATVAFLLIPVLVATGLLRIQILVFFY